MPNAGSLPDLGLSTESLDAFLLDTAAAASIFAGEPSGLYEHSPNGDYHPCEVTERRALPISAGRLLVTGRIASVRTAPPSEGNGWTGREKRSQGTLLLAVVPRGQWMRKPETP